MRIHRLTFNPFQVEPGDFQQIDTEYCTSTAASPSGLCHNTANYLFSKIEHARSDLYLKNGNCCTNHEYCLLGIHIFKVY
jgi:hypothetical protein